MSRGVLFDDCMLVPKGVGDGVVDSVAFSTRNSIRYEVITSYGATLSY